jgi:hypothetical protein
MLTPALKPAVDGAVIAKLLGQFVPLAAAPHAKEDAIDRTPPVGTLAARRFGGSILQEDGFDPLP